LTLLIIPAYQMPLTNLVQHSLIFWKSGVIYKFRSGKSSGS